MFSADCSEVASDNSQSFDAMDEDNASTNNGGLNNGVSIFNQTPWYKMPELSLLDLAFKLKQAEMRIFGRDKKFLENKDNELMEDVRLSSDLYLGIEPSAKRALLEINEKYLKLEASFPRNLTEEVPSRLFDPVNFSSESSRSNEKLKKRFGCGWCGYNTDSKSHLHRHHKSMHRDKELKILTDPDLFIPPKKSLPVEGKRKHQCDMCSYQTDCKSHLRRHQGSVHCKDKLYECPICKIEFSRSEKAKEHHFAFHPERSFDIRNMRKPPVFGDSSRSQSIDKMDKIRQLYEDADHLLKISKSHLAKNSLLRMGTSLSLENHKNESCEFNLIINEVDSNDSIWMDVPDAKRISDGKKKPRVKNNNAFVCLKCDYSCRDLWHLRRHVLDVHSSHKEHNCRVCHYATNMHHWLFCHMLKHGELFCNFCDFSTTNSEVYKLHFQVCSVVRKITKCSVCSKDFDDFVSYKNHVTDKHRELIVACPKCQFFTESSTELQSHLGLHVWEDKVCPLCHFMAENDESFSQHCCDSHLTSDPDWSETWICNECGKGEPDMGMAVAHIACHIGATQTCTEAGCSFRCHLVQSLELHLKYMHQPEDDKASMTAYINQLENQIQTSHNRSAKKYEDIKVEEMEVGDSLETFGESKSEVDSSAENREESSKEIKETSQKDADQPVDSNASPSSPKQDLPPVITQATQPSGYICPRCPDRPPFRYKKSFEKHMSHHVKEDEEEEEEEEEDEIN